MKTSRHQIAKLLAERTLQPGFRAKEFSRSVAAYLLENDRIRELDSLMRDVVEYRARQGVVEVVAVSAHPLQNDARQDIAQIVKRRWPKSKRVVVSEQQDSSVIGGVRLELPHAQLDLTVRSRLNRFKQLTTPAGEE